MNTFAKTAGHGAMAQAGTVQRHLHPDNITLLPLPSGKAVATATATFFRP